MGLRVLLVVLGAIVTYLAITQGALSALRVVVVTAAWVAAALLLMVALAMAIVAVVLSREADSLKGFLSLLLVEMRGLLYAAAASTAGSFGLAMVGVTLL